ncbi:hypothetical protein A9Y57_00121 [Streptococcus parauberis]|uniref:Uncharacterized protein n=1 Tax=Streptococcus parauberis TaxID=1348 RepID=A0A854WFM4_9STRE|nr:hypothetical protein [Streptococcus parauberis]PCH13853.1 hypothetical protein A9Y57_00487 [Streptococcus parauberis]PCH14119.1 hypothetical protein A9Y57_00121 [Streptococcus parauberis]
MEVCTVNKVNIAPILLNDETAAAAFSLRPDEVGTIRREMQKMPRWYSQLYNYGRLMKAEVVESYLSYRGSEEWKKEYQRATGKKK